MVFSCMSLCLMDFFNFSGRVYLWVCVFVSKEMEDPFTAWLKCLLSICQSVTGNKKRETSLQQVVYARCQHVTHWQQHLVQAVPWSANGWADLVFLGYPMAQSPLHCLSKTRVIQHEPRACWWSSTLKRLQTDGRKVFCPTPQYSCKVVIFAEHYCFIYPNKYPSFTDLNLFKLPTNTWKSIQDGPWFFYLKV